MCLTMECEEMNDSRVMGRDVSQIHINNQTNTLRMHNCGMSKTYKVLLCLHNWTESIWSWQRPYTSTGTWLPPLNNEFSHYCFYGLGSLSQTWLSVCVGSLLTCLMLLLGSLIKCAEGVQLKRDIDKQSP